MPRKNLKYLKEYKEFILFTDKHLDSCTSLVERILYKEIEKNFWRLSLDSKVFTLEEKYYIKENLMNVKIDLINEEVDFLNKTLTAIKDTGGKIYNTVKKVVVKLKENLTSVISGIIDFLKSVVRKIGQLIIPTEDLKVSLKKEFKSQIDQFKTKIKSSKKTEWDEEKENLKQTATWLKTKLTSAINSNIQNQSDGVETSLESDLDIITDAENESVNILDAFYNFNPYEKINEDLEKGDKFKFKNNDGEEVEREVTKVDGDKVYFIGKDGKEYFKLVKDITSDVKNKVKDVVTDVGKAKDSFLKWVLDMKETSPPTEGKARWWIKLILKVISFCFSFWNKIISASITYLQKNSLKFGSIVVSKLKGPGPFEFVLMTTVGLALYGYVKKAINFFEQAFNKESGFEVLSDAIRPFLEEYIPYLDNIESFLAVALLFLVCYDLYNTMNEIDSDDPYIRKEPLPANHPAAKEFIKRAEKQGKKIEEIYPPGIIGK